MHLLWEHIVGIVHHDTFYDLLLMEVLAVRNRCFDMLTLLWQIEMKNGAGSYYRSFIPVLY